jgi:hypothetical protein
MADPFDQDDWLVVRAQFDDDDLDTVFRFRTGLPPRAFVRARPTLIILKWPYSPKKDGMPRDADLKRMGAFEDALEAAVEATRLGFPVACLTGNGRRTWRYFVAEPAAFLAAVEPLLKAHGPAPHVFRQVDDPAWEGLTDLLPLLECADGD